LRHAKTSYMLGNYVGSIALCGLVAETMAILIYELNTDSAQEREEFEDLDQYRRVAILKERALITPTLVQRFGDIRGMRKQYLHVWTSTGSRVQEDARRSYAIATELVREAMSIKFSEGRVILPPKVAEYLKARGVVVRKDGD
jgi:hypothetical protein